MTDKEIKHAVRVCNWRQNIGGVSICAGSCNICSKLIESGQCQTLQRLFKEAEKEKIINDKPRDEV